MINFNKNLEFMLRITLRIKSIMFTRYLSSCWRIREIVNSRKILVIYLVILLLMIRLKFKKKRKFNKMLLGEKVIRTLRSRMMIL